MSTVKVNSRYANCPECSSLGQGTTSRAHRFGNKSFGCDKINQNKRWSLTHSRFRTQWTAPWQWQWRWSPAAPPTKRGRSTGTHSVCTPVKHLSRFNKSWAGAGAVPGRGIVLYADEAISMLIAGQLSRLVATFRRDTTRYVTPLGWCVCIWSGAAVPLTAARISCPYSSLSSSGLG